MRKKGRQSTKTFKVGNIATLFVPKKIWTTTEYLRLAIQVIESNNSRYTLLTKHALLFGQFQSRELNIVKLTTAQLLSEEIPFKPWKVNSKTVTKKLTEVVQMEYGRPSIRALQQGRKRDARRMVMQALAYENNDDDEDSNTRTSRNGNANIGNESSSSKVQIIETLVLALLKSQ